MNFFQSILKATQPSAPMAYVLHSTTFTTVAAVQEDLDAITVEISPANASPILSGHQVNLNFGNLNLISITVTDENGVTKQYTVNVKRRHNGGRLPFRDFNFLTTCNSDANPKGL